MKTRYRVSITYDYVTPESAEHGEAEETGFSQTSKLYTLRDVVNELTNRFHLENFCPTSNSQSLYECDGEVNYQTGGETREAVHVDPNKRFKRHQRAMHWLNAVLVRYNNAKKLGLH